MPGRPAIFRPRGAPTPAEQERQAEQERGSARERGYSAQWDRVAKVEKALHPLCLGCLAIGLTTPTAVIDHIEPHKGDLEKFWNPANRQPACSWHHDVVKQILEQRFQRGEIGLDALRLDSPQAVALSRELMDQGEHP